MVLWPQYVGGMNFPQVCLRIMPSPIPWAYVAFGWACDGL
jgi:hypothetical protein